MNKTWQRILALSKATGTFSWLVVLPTLVVAFYYGFIASPVYVSETHFTVRSQSGGSVNSGLLSNLMSGGGAGSVSTQDIAIVSDYIQSRDVLEKIDAQLDLKSHFTNTEIDLWARLAKESSREDFLQYYQGKIEILMNDATGIISLKTKAFDAQTAMAMAQQILVHSETLVNDLSDQMTKDSIAFARSEMDEAEQRLREASQGLTEYRNLTNILDPTEKTGAVMGIVTGLESSLAEARAERDQLLSFLREESTQIMAINARIAALEEQVNKENQRLTGEQNVELSAVLQDYERLSLDKEIAHQMYLSTLKSLESARDSAARKQLYLVTFVRPSLAESAEEPEGIWNTAMIFVILVLVYVTAGLMITTVRDHIGF